MCNIETMSMTELIALEERVFKLIEAEIVKAGLYMAEKRFGPIDADHEYFSVMDSYINDEGFNIEIGVENADFGVVLNEYHTVDRELLVDEKYKAWFDGLLEEERRRKEEMEKLTYKTQTQYRYEQYLKLKEEFENA